VGFKSLLVHKRASSDWRLLGDCPFALEVQLAKPTLEVGSVERIAQRGDDARDISTLTLRAT
jgi:hypothetical protein